MSDTFLPDHRNAAQESIIAPGEPTRDVTAALHEVSNALTVIVGWIDRARAEVGSPAELHRALEIASSRATDARAIVRRAIGAEVEAEPLRLADVVVAAAVIGVEPEAERAGVDLTTMTGHLEADALIANSATVIQILTNLLLNAIAMSPPGAQVVVDIRSNAHKNGVVFGVSDEGPGVPVDRRATLFTAGASTRAGGAGIGLRHAARLARSYAGELALADSVVGARFELRWPTVLPTGETIANAPLRRRESVFMPVPAMVRSRVLEGMRVLVVEDDEAVIDLLDLALSARGAQVVSVRHLDDLEATLAQGPFDAALFDISPIADDIVGALALTRQANSAVRIVLISGSALFLPALPVDWVAAWVRKPFEVNEILQALEASRL